MVICSGLPRSKRFSASEKYLYLYSVVVSASGWWRRVGGMIVEIRQVRKGKLTVGVSSPDENLPATAGRGNRTHDPLVRCFIADSGSPSQIARPPKQFRVRVRVSSSIVLATPDAGCNSSSHPKLTAWRFQLRASLPICQQVRSISLSRTSGIPSLQPHLQA